MNLKITPKKRIKYEQRASVACENLYNDGVILLLSTHMRPHSGKMMIPSKFESYSSNVICLLDVILVLFYTICHYSQSFYFHLL